MKINGGVVGYEDQRPSESRSHGPQEAFGELQQKC